MRHSPLLLLAVAGALLGHWMFSIRGAALFAGAAISGYFVHQLIGGRSLRIANAAFLLLAAAALYACSTLGWGGADAPDRSRYKASPVGLSHVLRPDQPTSPTEDCGWYAVSGYPMSCAIADRNAFAALRVAYPLVIAAAILCVISAVLSLVRGSAAWMRGQRVSACIASGLALAAPVLFVHTLSDALAALRGLPVGVGGSLGTMQLSAAILLCLTVCLSPAHQRAARAAEY